MGAPLVCRERSLIPIEFLGVSWLRLSRRRLHERSTRPKGGHVFRLNRGFALISAVAALALAGTGVAIAAGGGGSKSSNTNTTSTTQSNHSGSSKCPHDGSNV